jgi:hypothetical protein
MGIILSTLETWQNERAPLVLEQSQATNKRWQLIALGKLIELDERMASELDSLGIRRGGYTLPPALELARKADPRALGILAQWDEERSKLDAAEMALPSSEARYPIAKVKIGLDARMMNELAGIGVPVWGLQIESAIQIIRAVCAERQAAN